jgi:hypothetical protein
VTNRRGSEETTLDGSSIELVSELALAYQRDERSPAVNCFLADLDRGTLDWKKET